MKRGDEAHALRVLVLAPFPPGEQQAHGGARAVAHLVAGLGGHAAIALAHLRAEDEPPVDENLARQCDTVLELPRLTQVASGRGRLARRLRLAVGLSRGRPMWATDYRPAPTAASRLRRLIREWRPNVLQVEYPVMVPWISARSVFDILVMTDHDPAHAAAAERSRAATGTSRMLLALDAAAWRRAEQNAIRRANAVVVFTQRDRDAIRRLAPEGRTEVIPLGVPLPSIALDPEGTADCLVFVGNFVHAANRDAALWLARDILPLIRRRVPEARLELVGEDLTGELQRTLGSQPGIVVVGRVEDATVHLDRAAVVLAPLRTGGGMRIKVLEALAAGKAVVTTPIGAAGISLGVSPPLRIASTPNELADATVSLLLDPSVRRRLGEDARRWAERQDAVNDRGAAYARLYHDLLREPLDRGPDGPF